MKNTSLTFLIALMFFTACQQRNNDSAGNADQPKPDSTTTEIKVTETEISADTTIVATFKDINTFEGDVSLLFKDDNGKEFWFNTYDTTFFSTVELGSGGPPQFNVNTEKQGEKFTITYSTETRENENSGEMTPFRIITSITPIN